MKEYKVTVNHCGNVVKTVRGIVSDNAEKAIAFVEKQMGLEPVRMIKSPETGKIVLCGHCYCFVAEQTT